MAPAAKQAKRKDILDRIVSRIQASQPRGSGGNEPVATFEVARTTKDIVTRITHVLMTGNPSIDRNTGGIPFRRVTEIYGPEYCGKTALAKLIGIRAQQRQIFKRTFDKDGRHVGYEPIEDNADVTILYVDNEQSIDQDAKIWFVDLDGKQKQIDWALGYCDTIDQIFKLLDKAIEVLDEEEKETKRPQYLVYIVDTIGGTSGNDEVTAEWGKEDYPRTAKQIRRGFRRMIREIGQRNVAVICTNQVGANFNGQKSQTNSPLPQERDFVTPGGKALPYFASLRLYMASHPKKYVLVKGAKNSAGLLIATYTKKNRMIKPFRESRVALLFDHDVGLHPEFSMLETFIFLDFATESKDTAKITFRFAAHGITKPATFAPAEPKKGQKKPKEGEDVYEDPVLEQKHLWPTFYQEHKADFDQLWELAMIATFKTDGFGPDSQQPSSLTLEDTASGDDILELPDFSGPPAGGEIDPLDNDPVVGSGHRGAAE